MFKPAKHGHLRMAPWQITNHMPAINFIANATDQEQVAIAKCVLSFRCTITNKNAEAIQEGTLHLAPSALRIKGTLIGTSTSLQPRT